ncbi:MAG: peptidoglycan-binding domain-containing protein, partial [Patescibacteria group bacterium]
MKKLVILGVVSAFIVVGFLLPFGTVKGQGLNDINESLKILNAQFQALQNQLNSLKNSPTFASPVSPSTGQQGGIVQQGKISSIGSITLEELPGSPQVSCALPELKLRSQQNSVYLLQMTLKQLGNYPEGLITGYYGNKTQKAVQAFQKANNLPVSGQVDTATSKLLTSLVPEFY